MRRKPRNRIGAYLRCGLIGSLLTCTTGAVQDPIHGLRFEDPVPVGCKCRAFEADELGYCDNVGQQFVDEYFKQDKASSDCREATDIGTYVAKPCGARGFKCSYCKPGLYFKAPPLENGVIVLPAWKIVKSAPEYTKKIDHKKNVKTWFTFFFQQWIAVTIIAISNSMTPSTPKPNSQRDVQTCQHCSILTLVNPPNQHWIFSQTRCWTSCYTAWDYLYGQDQSSVLVLDNTGQIESRASAYTT